MSNATALEFSDPYTKPAVTADRLVVAGPKQSQQFTVALLLQRCKRMVPALGARTAKAYTELHALTGHRKNRGDCA